MKLLEFQAKELLKENGIPTPEGKVIEGIEDLAGLDFPAVLKAQVPVGGRGKAGGIRVVEDPAEAGKAAAEIFSLTIKGYGVNTLLAESAHPIEREIYIACLHDKNMNCPMFMASSEGGVEIETLAEESPEKIVRQHIDPSLGLMEYDIRGLAAALDLPADRDFRTIVSGMWEILRKGDATLVEINPLVVSRGKLIALDGKIVLDDNAAFRARERHDTIKSGLSGKIVQDISPPERLAETYDISYVLLDGDIGIIADGAGTGMLTLDMVKDFGGRPANFCEMGGKAAEEAAEQAMEIVLANPNVKVLLISLIGGLTRMDRVAEGIHRYLEKNGNGTPLAVRMCGTSAEEGKAILAKHGITAHEDLSETVRAAIELGGK